MWRSPKGECFNDPTEAVAHAIVHSASVRDQFAGPLLAPWGRLTWEEYQARQFVRAVVDNVLAVAGYKRV